MKTHSIRGSVVLVLCAFSLLLPGGAARAQKKSDLGDFPFWTGKGGSPAGPYAPGLNAALLLTDEQKLKIQEARQETIGSEAVGDAGRKMKTNPNLTDAEREELRKIGDEARAALKEKVKSILTVEQKEFIERASALHGTTAAEVNEEFSAQFASAKGSKADMGAVMKEYQVKLQAEFARKLEAIMTPAQSAAMQVRAALERLREIEAANAPKKTGGK